MKNKKIISLMLVFVLVLSSAISVFGETMTFKNGDKQMNYSGNKIAWTLNGTDYSLSTDFGFFENDEILMPIKSVFVTSPFKASYTYDSITGVINIKYLSNTIKMTVGKKTAYVNGVKKTMPTYPRKVKADNWKKNKIYIPIEFVATNLGIDYEFDESTFTVKLSKDGLELEYDNDTYLYTSSKIKYNVNSELLDVETPGIFINKISLSSLEMLSEAMGFSYKVNGKNVTVKKDDITIKYVLGSKKAYINGSVKNMKSEARTIYNKNLDKSYVYVPTKFLVVNLGGSYLWNKSTSTTTIKIENKVATEATTEVSTTEEIATTEKMTEQTTTETATTEVATTEVATTEKMTEATTETTTEKVTEATTEKKTEATTETTTEATKEEEFKAVWISYYEVADLIGSEKEFKSKLNKMFDNCVDLGMNTVIVHVRAFSDAMYPSEYFPWSKYISGTQGKALDYDPLEYMIEAAHKRNLEFHAWLNPYRVTSNNTSYTALSSDNPARKWMLSSKADEKRNVLSYDGNLYYNPSKTDVQNLIVSGVEEIVENYDVDGIHFDDYFYPSFSTSNVSTKFDAEEYNEYVKECKKNGKTYMTIANWRRNNVNTLIKKVYKAVKNINKDVVFGISPAGNINNLKSNYSYYVDIDSWLSNEGYVDYICPQIYWSFKSKTEPFDKIFEQWLELNQKQIVKMYIGIATYKAGATLSGDTEWSTSNTVMKRQIEYARKSGKTSGFAFFSYTSFYKTSTQKEVKNLLSIL